jgi:hypothetical protein
VSSKWWERDKNMRKWGRGKVKDKLGSWCPNRAWMDKKEMGRWKNERRKNGEGQGPTRPMVA